MFQIRWFVTLAFLSLSGFAAAPAKLTFEKNLEIGSDEGEAAYEFGAGSQFAVGERAIFVLDSQNCRVHVFDLNGKHERSFGSRGEGPGEFGAPGAILLTRKGEVVVTDTQRRMAWFFSQEGELKGEKRLPERLVAMIMPSWNAKGGFISTNIRLDEASQQVFFVTIFDEEMAVVKDLQFTKLPAVDWSKSREAGFWAKFLAHQFDLALSLTYAAATPAGYAVSVPGKYDLTLVDAKGVEVGRPSYPFKPQPMSEETRRSICEQVYEGMRGVPFLGQNLNNGVFEAALKQSQAPPYKNPIAALFGTDRGFATLVNYREDQETGQIELFDAKGKRLGEGSYKGGVGTFAFVKGQLYVMNRDKTDDVTRLRRYKVKGL